MSKAEDTLNSVLDALKKETEKEQLNPERVTALAGAIAALSPLKRI